MRVMVSLPFFGYDIIAVEQAKDLHEIYHW